MTDTRIHPIETTFTAEITTERNSGWACAVVPDSGERFGTRKPVRVRGTVDGHPFEATMLPVGGGNHMVPLRAALRKTIGKGLGDEVTINIAARAK